MSEQEFEQGTEELFGVVNTHASDTAKLQAELIARREMEVEDAKRKEELAQKKLEAEEEKKTARTKTTLCLIVRLLICTLAAALFVGALLLPSWVPVLCFSGLAVCLIVGAVTTDRFIRSWR